MRLLAVVMFAVTLQLTVRAQDENTLLVGQMGSMDLLQPGAMPGKVTVYVNGKETAGKAGEELPGSRQFSVSVPKGARVTIMAVDTDEWEFVKWAAVPGTVLAEAAKSSDTNAAEMLKMNRQPSFTFGDKRTEFANAQYSHRPGSGKIDLVADYETFLKEIKMTETQAELDGVNGGRDSNTTIPGRAMASLFDAAMKKRAKAGNLHDSVVPKEVWDSYCKNLKELDKALPMASPAARRALAAFAICSSTDYKFWGLINAAVKKGYGVDLDDIYFETIGAVWFGTVGNADGDSLTNGNWLGHCCEVRGFGIHGFPTMALTMFSKMSLPCLTEVDR
jgi:hypothetical protein